MDGMSTLSTFTLITMVAGRIARRVSAGAVRTGRFTARTVGIARRRGGNNDPGMMRLLDLHGASCAGDTLVAIGLAGTVFSAPSLEAERGKVALYLLITMLPFAILAPVVGPLLDRFRHGRRYALAVTFLGRGFLAYLISDHLDSITLYVAAIGMLVLSRAYGVARSAAVPRVLPHGMGLSEAGARASAFGTLAGAVVVPLGLLGYLFGSQWTLRMSMIVFVIGMVVSLRLPQRTDSQPPQVLPRWFQLPGHRGAKVLTGRLVLASLAGSATMRALYGFLALHLAFSIQAGQQSTELIGVKLSQTYAVGLVAVALGLGTFLAVMVGTTLNIRRPALLQAVAISLGVLAVGAAALHSSMFIVTMACLCTAIGSGLAKLAIDATIQDRIPEAVRASAFTHSETLLILAWVAGGGLGLIPFTGGTGLVFAAVFALFALARALLAAVRLGRERLRDTPILDVEPAGTAVALRSAQSTQLVVQDGQTTTQALPAEVPQATRGRRPLLRRRGAEPTPTAQAAPATPAAQAAPTGPTAPAGEATTTPVLLDPGSDGANFIPPGYHLYRPDPTLRTDRDGAP